MTPQTAWNLLPRLQDREFRRRTQAGDGEPFTFRVAADVLRFMRAGREVKSAHRRRFEEFFQLWSDGERNPNSFRNKGAKASKAEVIHFLLPLFEQVVAESSDPVLLDHTGFADQKRLEAVRRSLEEEGEFDPHSVDDGRTRTLRAIASRQGQGRFRAALLAAYERRCAVTDCDIPEALEAAHILPYRGAETNHVMNGLLLRADIHSLFDLHLLWIDTSTMTVRLSSTLAGGSYSSFQGTPLRVPKELKLRPSREALGLHAAECLG